MAAVASSQQPSALKHVGLRFLVRCIFYLAVACFVTYPVVFHLSDRLLGHPDVDVWNHVWGFWWVKTSLLEEHRLPLFTEFLAYPKGGRLYFIDPLNALLSIPLQIWMGLVPAYNLVLIGELAFTGLGMHWMARSIGASERGAYLAGLLVCASPILRCEMHNGITEVGNVGWLIVSILMTHRALNVGRLRDALAAGFLAGMAFVACWYFGLATGLVGMMLVLHRLIETRPVRTWLHAHWTAIAIRLAGFALCSATVAAPFWLTFLKSMEGDGSIIKRSPGLNSFLLKHNATDLLSFIHPGQFYSPDLWTLHQERFLHTTYLGFVGLGLAVWGLGNRIGRPWGVIGAVFGLLALGPYLFVAGNYVTISSHLIPLPFALLSHGIGLMAITHPSRMVIVTLICLAVLAALGMDRLEARFPRVGRFFMPVLASCLILEFFLFSPGPFPMTTAAAQPGPCETALAQDPSPGAVLDLPVQYRDTMRTSRYLYNQTFHRRPTPYLVNVRAQSTPWLHQSYIYQWIRSLPNAEDETIPEQMKKVPAEQWKSSLENDLRAIGYRYIVVHRDIISPPFGAWPYRRIFDPVLGPPVSTPDGCWIYRIDPLEIRRPGGPYGR